MPLAARIREKMTSPDLPFCRQCHSSAWLCQQEAEPLVAGDLCNKAARALWRPLQSQRNYAVVAEPTRLPEFAGQSFHHEIGLKSQPL